MPYYIILSNPLYYRDFYYICCDVPDRDALIKDDDDDEGNELAPSKKSYKKVKTNSAEPKKGIKQSVLTTFMDFKRIQEEEND